MECTGIHFDWRRRTGASSPRRAVAYLGRATWWESPSIPASPPRHISLSRRAGPATIPTLFLAWAHPPGREAGPFPARS